MSTIDEALKKLGDETKVPMSDIGFVAGPRKRRPFSLLLALALVGAGLLVYWSLPEKIPQPVRKAGTSAAASHAPVSAPGQAAQFMQENTVSPSSVAADDGQAALPPPAWYVDGWAAARAGKWTDALALWEGGVRGLPGDRVVIVSNSYAEMDMLPPALSQHTRMFPAIGVRQRLGGKLLYRVIVFPYGGANRQVLPKAQDLFVRAWLVNASHVQASLAESFAPVTTMPAQVTVREKQPREKIAREETKPPAERKPPLEKLETKSRIAADAVTVEALAPAVAASANAGANTSASVQAGDWEARAGAVRELLKAEDYAGVGKDAQTLARDFPGRWEGWFWLGTAQLAQGRMDAAETALETASNLNPTVAEIWVQRAIVAQERGDHASAIRLLEQARELSPKSPKIYLNLGYSNEALGLTAEAEKNYLRFLSLTEGDSSYALQRKPILQRLERKQLESKQSESKH